MRLLYQASHANRGARVPDTPLAPCMMEQLGTTWIQQVVPYSASFSQGLHGDGQSGCEPGKQEGSLFAQPESLGYAHCCSNVNVYEGCNKILN